MNLAEWFVERDKDIPKPKYNYGDRVFAKYLGHYPLVGMVIRQNSNGVLIHADLPLGLPEGMRNVIYCNPKTVKNCLSLMNN